MVIQIEIQFPKLVEKTTQSKEEEEEMSKSLSKKFETTSTQKDKNKVTSAWFDQVGHHQSISSNEWPQ